MDKAEIRAKLEEIRKTIEEGLRWLEVEKAKIDAKLACM